MELYEYIRRYRELSSMTQAMFAEEIYNNTNRKIKPTVGVINGIERGGNITDERLYNYLYKEFLYVDPDKSKRIVNFSYEIADFCVKNERKLDVAKLFSCITLYDIFEYLGSVVGDMEIATDDVKGIFTLLSDVVDVKYDQSGIKSIVINDLAIFVYNLCLWYFLLSNNEEMIITKEEYSSDEFAKLATAFGFQEFQTTSEKARGKIAKTIGKRFSICNHYYNLIDSINLYSYFNDDLIKHYTAALKKYADNNENLFDALTIKKDVFDGVVSLIQSSGDVEYNEDEALIVLNNMYNIKNLLFSLYSFFQGRFEVPSSEYIKDICEKIEAQDIYSINPNLRNTVDTLVARFHNIIDNYEENFSDTNTAIETVEIQRTLFDIYKYNYIIKNKIEKLAEPKSDD